MGDKELIRRTQLADALQVHPTAITRLIQRGMPVIRISERRIRFCLADVRAWLEANPEGGV